MTMHPSVDNYTLKKLGLPEHDCPQWMRVSAPQHKGSHYDKDGKDAEREAKEKARRKAMAEEAAERRKANAEAKARELADKKAKREAEKAERERISRQRQEDRRAGRKVTQHPAKSILIGSARKAKATRPDGSVTCAEAVDYLAARGVVRSRSGIEQAVACGRLKAVLVGHRNYIDLGALGKWAVESEAHSRRARVIKKTAA